MMPTRPGQWRVAVHIFGVDGGPGIHQELNALFGTERGSAVQRGFAFGSAVMHENTGGDRLAFCHIRVRPVRK